eukprot:1143071-Pelagomonas_calceolata.AAC.5
MECCSYAPLQGWSASHLGYVNSYHDVRICPADRQHKARELLHKITQSLTQSVTDYVRYLNSLVQRAGDPVPSMTDVIVFFHAGLLPYMKDKTTTNPATGKFWTDLHTPQEYAINIHMHGSNKSATMVPASSRAFSSTKPTHLVEHRLPPPCQVPRPPVGARAGGEYWPGANSLHAWEADGGIHLVAAASAPCSPSPRREGRIYGRGDSVFRFCQGLRHPCRGLSL